MRGLRRYCAHGILLFEMGKMESQNFRVPYLTIGTLLSHLSNLAFGVVIYKETIFMEKIIKVIILKSLFGVSH